MKPTETILDRIMVDVRREVAAAQAQRPLGEVQRMLRDAPPVRSLRRSLEPRFCLIAEIKERSPSQGAMRAENVQRAAASYEASPGVRGLSVLTNQTHFGMHIGRLQQVRLAGTKPVLRKDFIYDPYQVYEARAFGADAILLMANLLEREELQRLFTLASELGLEVLFECHDPAQIEALPAGAQLCGINSRTFSARQSTYADAQARRAAGEQKDLTTDLRRFELGRLLPAGACRVAESGVRPQDVPSVRALGLFHAVLVGTSLLMSAEGIDAELAAFERALASPAG